MVFADKPLSRHSQNTDLPSEQKQQWSGRSHTMTLLLISPQKTFVLFGFCLCSQKSWLVVDRVQWETEGRQLLTENVELMKRRKGMSGSWSTY